MRTLITTALLALPFVAQAHGDHDLQPHTHGELLLAGAIVLVGLAVAWPLLKKLRR